MKIPIGAFVIIATLFFCRGVVAISPAGVQLNEILSRYQTLSFRFHQQVFNGYGVLAEEASGQALLSRPDKIRWEVLKPYKQLVVSDGDVVWLYDPDLFQAIRRPLIRDKAESLALVLFGSAEELATHFTISVQGKDERSTGFLLVPKDKSVYFDSLELLFKGDRVYELILADSHDQQTIFTLSRFKLNPQITPAVFRFSPPEGIDVSDEVGRVLK